MVQRLKEVLFLACEYNDRVLVIRERCSDSRYSLGFDPPKIDQAAPRSGRETREAFGRQDQIIGRCTDARHKSLGCVGLRRVSREETPKRIVVTDLVSVVRFSSRIIKSKIK